MERTALESIPEQVVLTEEAPLEEQQPSSSSAAAEKPSVASEGENAIPVMETPTGDRLDDQERARQGEGEGEGEDRPTPLTVHAKGEEMHEEMQSVLPLSSAPAAPVEEQASEPMTIAAAVDEPAAVETLSASATPKKKKQRRGFWYRLLHFFGAPKHESAEGEGEAEGVTEEDAGKASSSAAAAKGEREADTDREESFQSQGKPAAEDEQVMEAVKHAEEDVDESSTKEQGMT